LKTQQEDTIAAYCQIAYVHSTWQVCPNNVEEHHWHVAPSEPIAKLHVSQAVFLQHFPC